VYRDKNAAIATSAGPAERSGSPAGVVNRLSLSELIHRVVAQNRQIQIQQAEWDIKQAEEKGTHAIFEPDFVTTAEDEDNSKKNTPQESLNRLGEDVYTERNWYYRVEIEGLVPTGGKVNLGYELRQLSNIVTKDLTDEEDEHEVYLGLNVRQPLLKNAGIETTKTGDSRRSKGNSSIISGVSAENDADGRQSRCRLLGFLPDPGKSSIEAEVGPNCRQNPGGQTSAPPDRQNGGNRSS